ncbi:hypothetical protein TcCL_Unassigned03195 [Trypanosoma cruzi]|nr:hypothetical protein TcCL_Unassigned03195 [Trypanosoma cruzi]
MESNRGDERCGRHTQRAHRMRRGQQPGMHRTPHTTHDTHSNLQQQTHTHKPALCNTCVVQLLWSVHAVTHKRSEKRGDHYGYTSDCGLPEGQKRLEGRAASQSVRHLLADQASCAIGVAHCDAYVLVAPEGGTSSANPNTAVNTSLPQS